MKARIVSVTILLLASLLTTLANGIKTEGTIPSHGTINYSIGLPRINVEGNAIHNETGPFFLVGCNVRGQAYNPLDGLYDDWWTYRNADAQNIKSYGFNTIRLLAYWEELETSQDPSHFTYDEAYIEKIRQTVEAYNQQGIYVIINLYQHSSVNTLGKFVPTLGNDCDFADTFYSDTSPASAREHLKHLWLRLSETFKNYTGVAGYDICGEPRRSSGSLSDQQIADLWFDIADYVIAALRNNGDNHIVFVNFSPHVSSSVLMSRKLIDPQVVYEPHWYTGINLTAPNWPVTNNDINWLRNELRSRMSKLESFGVPFVIGEFGFESLPYNADREKWVRNSLTVFWETQGFFGDLWWCFYEYGGLPSSTWWPPILMEYTKPPTPTP